MVWLYHELVDSKLLVELDILFRVLGKRLASYLELLLDATNWFLAYRRVDYAEERRFQVEKECDSTFSNHVRNVDGFLDSVARML